ncbi:unnamed protein product [Lactuca saligna]|uniref:Uncharacterized protein n=1 Tax=Lactuca saligna TaxID=75948 RepID=A0AA35VR91_LACSI|nr:unnamed protein product [Lactuca saligna]
MQDSFMYAILIFHTTNFIIADNCKLSFVGFILEAIFRAVPTASKILEAYRKPPISGFCPLTDEMRAILEEADKPKKEERRKMRKKATRKPRSPTPSESERSQSNTQLDILIEVDEPIQTQETAATLNPEVLQPIYTNREVTFQIPVSVPIADDFFDNFSIPYPIATISTPISIAPCLPVSLGVSQPPPIFTDSTTTLTTTVEPPVSLNAYDVGAGASCLDIGFTYSQFNIRTESDDEAPITRATVKCILETHTKEHSANLDKMKKAVDASPIVYNNTTEKVDKLINDAQVFMENFQSSFESSTVKANEVISSLGPTLKTEKVKLQEVHTGLKSEHDEFQSSISSQITKL